MDKHLQLEITSRAHVSLMNCCLQLKNRLNKSQHDGADGHGQLIDFQTMLDIKKSG